MLYLFRKSQRWLLWLLLIVVVVTFVFWGTKVPNLFRISPTAKLASYEGEKITSDDLRRAREGARVMLMMRGFKTSDLTDGVLTTQAVNYLVIMRNVKKSGVTIDNEMLKNQLAALAPVSAGGDVYRNYVASNFGIQNPRDFEEHVRDIVAYSVYARDVPSTFFQPENERTLDYVDSNVKGYIQYATFTSATYLKEATDLVTTNECETFFEENPKMFAQPEKYRFLTARFVAETGSVVFTEQDLKDYFDLYQGDYTTTNEFGEVIDQEYEAARPEVLKAFLAERANEDAREKAYGFRDSVAIKEEVSDDALIAHFTEAVKNAGVPLEDSQLLPVGQPSYFTSNGPAISKLLQDEPVGTLDVFEDGESSFQVYLLVTRTEASEPDFEEAKEEAFRICRQTKANELAENAAKALLEKIEANPAEFKSIAEAAESKVTEPAEPALVTQPVIPGVALEDYKKLFAAKAQTPLVLPGRNAYYVANVKEFVEADPAFTVKEQADRIANLRSAQELELYNAKYNDDIAKILAEVNGNLKKDDAVYDSGSDY